MNRLPLFLYLYIRSAYSASSLSLSWNLIKTFDIFSHSPRDEISSVFFVYLRRVVFLLLLYVLNYENWTLNRRRKKYTLNLFSRCYHLEKILSICVMNFNETGFNVPQSISIACKLDILLTCKRERKKAVWNIFL